MATSIFVKDREIRFSTDDPAAQRWFQAVGFCEPHTTKLIVDLLDEDSVFVDVGAWLGWHTCIAAQFAGEVHAFEMNRYAYDQLMNNIAMNNTNCTVYAVNSAVWDKAGALKYTPRQRPALSVNGSGAATVQAITLDEYFQDRHLPDVVKIDVEGAEMKVLQGMTELLEAGLHLILEIHSDKVPQFKTDAKGVIEYLENKGYEVRMIGRELASVPSELPRNFRVYARD